MSKGKNKGCGEHCPNIEKDGYELNQGGREGQGGVSGNILKVEPTGHIKGNSQHFVPSNQNDEGVDINKKEKYSFEVKLVGGGGQNCLDMLNLE